MSAPAWWLWSDAAPLYCKGSRYGWIYYASGESAQERFARRWALKKARRRQRAACR